MNTLLVFLLQTPAAPVAETPAIQPMQPLGWLFLVVSVSAVTVLTAWCFYKVLTAPPAE
jgi:hypothetical protein